MESGYLVLKRLTGQHFVYPGHPLVVASLIMQAYTDFASANKPTGLGFCEALGNNDIPGAGCHVGAAVWMLQLGEEGQSVDEMVQFAKGYWEEGRAGGHIDNVGPGQSQATAMEPFFRELAQTWFAH